MTDTEPTLINHLRRKMQSGELAVGMINRLVRGAEIVAIAKTAGFDCLFIDREHNGFSLETTAQIALAANMAGLTPLVRVAQLDEVEIAQAFDAGAMGVIIPGIESAAQARTAVAAAKFPPLGRRSVMPCLPQMMFRPMPAPQAMQAINDATLVIAMVESRAALDAVEEIAAVPGLDMLLVGANDLSNMLGHTGDLGHEEVRAGFANVAKACRANDIFFGVGGLGQTPELAKEMIALGARYATAGADITFMTNAAIANAKKFV
ncbi:2-keto-3-deoxy-L-rhamnonate aldolase RhmA [Limimaricola variabilis]|uniref:2-keto-3-deoxy-L-rhamnonate aldolase RhmA n=1 Tax=Limimaricola variabilis TaxID=1492771 RepID=A0ABR6HRA9_9RHOB|nr:aldolase/citrate lyase family protein [Limimaricola variabilis]MBB3713079.1 2-keto-3-deoxy-L-rhamnonate aldolase RhmA [Limimaricola variabilis]